MIVTQDAPWVPADIDITVPSVARVYDYLLGGAHNFAADRALGEKIRAMEPTVFESARLVRSALTRMVRHMVGSGIRQFLDLGSGIPTVANVHEIAHSVDPGCRVVYVDIDPIAVAHSELLLMDTDHADVLRADVRDPDAVLGSPQVTAQLNLNEPVGLLFMMVLHYLGDTDDPVGVVRRYRDAVPRGSRLAITHLGHGLGAENKSELDDAMRSSGNRDQLHQRTRDEVLALFGDWRLERPGLVSAGGWRPDIPTDLSAFTALDRDLHAGLARKP
ncbi:hypothetical protein D5S17_18455 [Pseudonocardiaceae bacterium YIM PH 21723]|nr:hypothetical protein D5S17_18455 [Pseudonocardiaceae bacterium YIM PH 21723]